MSTRNASAPYRVLYQLMSPLHRLVPAEDLAVRKELLQEWAGPALEIAMASPAEGPDSISCDADVAEAYLAARADAPHWRAQGYDAVVLGCFSDPALAALGQISGLPVIGPGSASLYFAAQIAERFSVLSSDPSPGGLRGRLRAMGLSDFFASERRVSASVAALRRRDPDAVSSVLEAARACVADGAQALVLGCLAMSFTPGLPQRLRDEIGVPVVNPVLAALKTAEISIAMSSAAPSSAQGKDCL